MWNAVANLRPQAARDLATYFSTLPPKAANDGAQELAGIGRTIYQEGLPDSNIVSCAACHGPNAEGVREIPRLGGLAYSYLKRRLEQWGEGYHAAAQPPMPRIASKLSPKEIEAFLHISVLSSNLQTGFDNSLTAPGTRVIPLPNTRQSRVAFR
jgi:cytochrome c553